MFDLYSFYRSKKWLGLLKQMKMDRLNNDGLLICEYCGKPMIKAYDIIGHHKEALTEDNVNNYEISLNPENIALVHHKCHNYIHNKLGYKNKEIYLVYGAPLSGKCDWVQNNAEPGDLVIDLDSIWECVSGCERYVKPKRLNAVVFAIRDKLLECAKYRVGKWNNAYIIGGYPLISERERLCKDLGAREIFIECDRDECVRRLFALDDSDPRKIDKAFWLQYIDNWFQQYMPPSDI